MKITDNEQKIANAISKVIVIELSILAYIVRFFVKRTWKLKRWLFRLAVVILLVNSALNALQPIVEAPKAHAELNGINYQVHTSEYDQIHSYIEQTFGKYSDKAFLILQGDGSVGACHENAGLNPKAVNTNWSKVSGVADSKDYGVFQINNKWQGVTNTAFLFDWKININMAWRIFQDNNYNFHLWTCGKEYGV